MKNCRGIYEVGKDCGGSGGVGGSWCCVGGNNSVVGDEELKGDL